MTLTEAVRVDDLLIDPETGEILSEQNLGLDALAALLRDAQEQAKAWDQTVGMLKASVGRKLLDAHQPREVTPSGTVAWRHQTRRSAKAATLVAQAAEYGLDDAQVTTLLAASATSLDPRALESCRATLAEHQQAIIDATIEEQVVSYVQLTPLRKAAPVIERVLVDREVC